MVTIANEHLQAEINLHGAELSSLKGDDGTEYMWQADPQVWARHAPVLFPIVGALKDDEYQYQGQTYHMTRHGFARDRDFEVLRQEDNAVELVLTDTAESRAKFPFAFRLVLSYRLAGNSLEVGYSVNNPSHDDELYFSIGAHPAFSLPLDAESAYDDYTLTFDPAETRTHIPLDGKYADYAQRDEQEVGQQALSHELFKDDALIYELNGEETTMSLKSSKGGHGVALTVSDAPYVGIWSNYPVPGNFCCIEPWWGIADAPDASGELTEKRGINRLAPGGTFVQGYTIKTF